jgi:hypothetical protein
LEQKVAGTYKKIPQAAQGEEIIAAKNIDRIAQAIDQYQKEIENLREQLTPTTPSTMKEKMKQEETTQLQEIEQQVSTTSDLFDKTT